MVLMVWPDGKLELYHDALLSQKWPLPSLSSGRARCVTPFNTSSTIVVSTKFSKVNNPTSRKWSLPALVPARMTKASPEVGPEASAVVGASAFRSSLIGRPQ